MPAAGALVHVAAGPAVGVEGVPGGAVALVRTKRVVALVLAGVRHLQTYTYINV